MVGINGALKFQIPVTKSLLGRQPELSLHPGISEPKGFYQHFDEGVLRQNSNLLRQKASKNGLIFCNAHKDHSL